MKKAFLFGALGMLLVVGIVFMFANYGQAGLTDTKTSITVSKGDNLTLGTKEVIYNQIWETYKPIEVKSATDEVLFKGAIVEHTAQCGSDCYSVVEVYKEKDGVLIDDLYLNDEQGNRLDIKPTVEISNTFKDVEVIDYKDECIEIETKNGTIVSDCKQVQSGSHIIKEPIYEKYTLGSSVKAGNYLIKPSATFELKMGESKTYDWIMIVDGKTLSEWATWVTTASISYLPTTTTTITSSSSSQARGQSFTVGASNINVTLVTLQLVHESGVVSGNLNVYIYALSGGLPTGNALSSGSIPASSIADTPTNYNITMSSIVLNASTQYGFFILSSASYAIGLRIETTQGYGGGSAFYTNSFPTSWTGYSGDAYFIIYDTQQVVVPCTFNGSVKTNTGVAVNGARVVITSVNTDTIYGNATTDANGLWNKNVSVNGNYSVYAYIPNNKTGGGDIKTYVECITS